MKPFPSGIVRFSPLSDRSVQGTGVGVLSDVGRSHIKGTVCLGRNPTMTVFKSYGRRKRNVMTFSESEMVGIFFWHRNPYNLIPSPKGNKRRISRDPVH